MTGMVKMDAGKATGIVKEYFVKAHEPLGVMLFRVEKVESDKGGKWAVECSFFTSMAASQRDYYRIALSAAGEILGVSKLK